MRGRDYLAVAREVVRGTTEAHWRTAAGRAYYALMLEVRDAMTRWGLSQPTRASVHQDVRRRCYTSTDVDMKQVGIALDNLRNHRGAADYDTAAVPAFANDTKAIALIDDAARTLALFDSLDADTPRAAAIFAEIQKVLP